MSAQMYSYWPLTNSMEQSPAWEATRSASSQAVPLSWLYQLVHYCIHKQFSPVPILSEIYAVHASHPTSWRSILLLFSHLYLGLPSGLSPSGLPSKTMYACLPSPIHVSCSTHLILLDLITWGCTDHESPPHSCYLIPLRSKYLSTLFPNTLNVTKFHTQTKRLAKL